MTAFISLSQSNILSTSSYDTITADDLIYISEANHFKQSVERRSYNSQKNRERSSQKYFVRKLRQGGATIQEQQRILEKIDQRKRRNQLNDIDNSTSESDSDHENNDNSINVSSKSAKKQVCQKKQLSKEKSDDSGFSSSSSTSTGNNYNTTKKSKNQQNGNRSNKRADRRRSANDDFPCHDSDFEEEGQSDNDNGYSTNSSNEEKQEEEDNENKVAGIFDERIRFKRNLNFQTNDMQAMSGQIKLDSNDWRQIVEQKLDQKSMIREHLVQHSDNKKSKKGKGSKSKNVCY
ncbi:hypothetical protein BGZ76_008499 [Entomortierella beljakovae]|nr:hypothetical protein BGZ76_008499 [Entomortierella beljakovae]